jgi:hypothetical protein
MTRATLTAKMALTAKMRDHVSWRGLHLLPKWRPTRAHKKSRTQSPSPSGYARVPRSAM